MTNQILVTANSLGFLVMLCLAIGGCMGPLPQAGEVAPPVPAGWQSHGRVAAGELLSDWLLDIGSEELGDLIAEGLAANYDLAVTAIRVEKARVLVSLEAAKVNPQVDLRASVQRGEEKQRQDGQSLTVANRRKGVLAAISWEVDLWGRLADLRDGSEADHQAALHDYRAAELSLAGRIAGLWCDAITSSLELRLAEETVANYRRVERSVDRRYQSGIGRPLDLHLARTDLAFAERLVSQRRNERQRLVKALQVLLGRYPDGVMSFPEHLPPIGADIPVGMPSSLLARRPDILAADRRWAAETARVSAARKAFLPQLSLTGEMGASSDSLRRLTSSDALLWNLLAGLTQPVFAGGRLKSEFEMANLELSEQAKAYGQAVLTAMQEVESLLDEATELHDGRLFLQKAVRETERAEGLAMDEYASGLTDIITVLGSQRRVLESRSGLLNIENELLQNRIALHVALGGGFHAATTRST